MKIELSLLSGIGVVAMAGYVCCCAQSEQWQPQKSRIEESPLLMHKTRGNWYLKQKYYKEARALYEQIRSELSAIEKIEEQFRTTLEQHQAALAKFYLEIGFAQGEVDGTLNQLSEDMKQLREQKRELTENERKLIADIEQKKKSLETLKKEFSTVDALTDALSKTTQTMEAKIKEAHALEQHSWEIVQAIAAEINDRNAEQMKLEVETNQKNLQQIDAYLTSNLFPFLRTKIQENESHIATIKDQAQDLRARGLELSKEVIEREKAAALKKQQAAAQKPVVPQKPAQPKEGFFARMWHRIINGFKRIGSWFSHKPATQSQPKV